MLRLSDLRPDGAVTRVSYAILNLSHRDSHAHPTPLEPGQRYRITLALNEIAHVFPRDHRLRIAISTCYWPVVWPAPEAATLTIHTDRSWIELPVRMPRAEDAELPDFLAVETAPKTATTELRPATIERHVTTDIATGEITYTILRDDGATRLDATGTVLETRKDLRYRTHCDDPLATRAEGEVVYALSRGDWQPRIRSRGVLTADRDAFTLQTDLDVHDGDRRIFARSWTERIARDLI